MCEKKDCSCDKKEKTVTLNYGGLRIEQSQTLRKDLPSSGLVYYLLTINSKNILIEFSSDETAIKKIKFENNLSELELDNVDITIDLESHRPQFTVLKFDISIEKDGKLIKIPKYIQDVILLVVNKKYYSALKEILKSNPEDKIIHTTLSQILGTSVSEIVDEVTAILEYPGSSNKKINANKSKDYYTKMASGTFGTAKAYSNFTTSDGCTISSGYCNNKYNCCGGDECLNKKCVAEQ
jgi:hypothetical protein